MSPEAKPNQAQEQYPQILREETVVPKKIRLDTARLSGNRLLKSLHNLGAENLTGHVKVYNAPPFKRTYFAEDHFITEMTATFGGFDADIPVGNGHGFGELIVDNSFEYAEINSGFTIDANLRFNNQPVRMYTASELKDKDNHRVSLVMPFAISVNREVLMESLPSDFTTAGLSYDFVRNPEHRDRLVSVAQKRIPVEVVNKDFPRSSVTGRTTPAGIDTQIRLNLQHPSPENHLKCYEVEIFEGEHKNAPQTTDVAPETIWQPRERHYCMVDGESYPFIPVKLDKISKLKMEINYKGNSPKAITDLLSDLPLSIDGTNQWYVEAEDSEGRLALLFKPEWGEKNAALVFNRVSSKRISSKEIHGALMRMDVLRKNLTERLAA